MITQVKINGTEYPFLFGMRVFWYYSNSGDVEFGKIEGMPAKYDAMLDVFKLANESALKRLKQDKPTLEDINLEEAIDDDVQVFMDLQEAFAKSKVFQRITSKAQGKDGKK